MNASPSPLKHLADSSGRLFWILQTVGWLGFLSLNYLAALGYGKPPHYIQVSAAVAATGFIVTSLLRYGYRAVANWPLRRMLAASAGMLVLATAVYAKSHAEALFRFCMDCRPESVLGYIGYFGTTLYVMLSWSGFYFGIRISRQLAGEREAALRAHAMAHEAQLKMLRYQLNPHFLFNTLNAISTLVLDGQNATANRMVSGLSDFLRHTLDSDPVQCVPLDDELAVIERYLGIEQLRFGERLRVRIDADRDARRGRVPSLILQPLIENSIKYAIARRAEGGTITIVARVEGDRLSIVVRDDGPGLPDGGAGKGVGLVNTRERLNVLYGDRQRFDVSSLDSGGLEVRLDLPFNPGSHPEACT